MLNSSFHIQIFITAGIYLATFIYLGINFLRNMPIKQWVLRLCLAPALFLHLLLIANRDFFQTSVLLQSLTLLSLLALILVFVNFSTNSNVANSENSTNSRNLASIKLPFIYIILPLASISLFALGFKLISSSEFNINFSLSIYLIILTIAYSLLILSIIQALILAWQYNRLKNKKGIGALDKLPPLQSSETLLFDLLTVAWIGLSFSILNSSSIFADEILSRYFVWIFALIFIVWIYFGIILLFKYTGKLSTLFAVKLVYVGTCVICSFYFLIYLFLTYF